MSKLSRDSSQSNFSLPEDFSQFHSTKVLITLLIV